MHQAVLLSGSNMGDSHDLLCRAVALINARIGRVQRLSRTYSSEPWGDFADKAAPFLNQGMVVDTELAPHALLDAIHLIENELGRAPHAVLTNPDTGTRLYSSRTIDIDIIFYDSLTLHTNALTIPHPRAHLRRFVLQPLAEIIPHYVHPELHLTVEQLLEGEGGKVS